MADYFFYPYFTEYNVLFETAAIGFYALVALGVGCLLLIIIDSLIKNYHTKEAFKDMLSPMLSLISGLCFLIVLHDLLSLWMVFGFSEVIAGLLGLVIGFGGPILMLAIFVKLSDCLIELARKYLRHCTC